MSDDARQVSEVLDLKFQVIRLKLQMLERERNDIVAEMRESTGAGPTDLYNPMTRLWEPAPPTKEPA